MVEKTDHEILIEIHSTLMGTNGQGGLCRRVEKNTKDIFKIWIIIAILLASGGGGAYALAHAVLIKAAGG